MNNKLNLNGIKENIFSSFLHCLHNKLVQKYLPLNEIYGLEIGAHFIELNAHRLTALPGYGLSSKPIAAFLLRMFHANEESACLFVFILLAPV